MPRKRRSKASTPKADAAARKRPDGSVSTGIYDAVEKLIAGNKMSRAAAFRQIAKQSGRKEGTVAVNYYYAARKRGAPLRRRGSSNGAAGRRATAGSPRIDAVLKSLGELIRAQSAELEALRKDNARFVAARKLFSGMRR